MANLRIMRAIGRIAAADVTLTETELAELDEAAPVGVAAGDRYPAGQMSTLTQ